MFLIRLVAGLFVAPALVVLAVFLLVIGVWPIVWVPVLLAALVALVWPFLGLGVAAAKPRAEGWHGQATG
jgi:hypothetical protein